MMKSDTDSRAASIKIAIAEAVREDALTADMMSITNSTSQIVDLMMFVIRKVRGFKLFRARRTISVRVRMRHIEIKAIQIGPTLEEN